MDAIKNVMAVLAGLIAVLTSLLTLYAGDSDIKKSAARESDAASTVTPTSVHPKPTPSFVVSGRSARVPVRAAFPTPPRSRRRRTSPAGSQGARAHDDRRWVDQPLF